MGWVHEVGTWGGYMRWVHEGVIGLVVMMSASYLADERFVWAKEDKFFMQLYAPATWQPIPNTRYESMAAVSCTCLSIPILIAGMDWRGLNVWWR